MGNAYPTSGHRKEFSSTSSVHADSAWDQEADTERASLIEENARLRALVVQLSTLVLRNVVDQHNTSPMMPVRRSLPD
jgi:predicted XRE-type DNA-binding protein